MVEDLDEVISRERLGFNFGAFLAQSSALIITMARVQEQVALRVQEKVALVEARAKEEMALAEEKKKEEMTLLAQTLATYETALNQELARPKRTSPNGFTKRVRRLSSCKPRSCPWAWRRSNWKKKMR